MRATSSLALAAALFSVTASAQPKKPVPPPVARKAPTPPSGPVPHAPDGKVDFSGVWVVATNLVLPGDLPYQPWAKKLYAEHGTDPEGYCLPDGAVRMTALPYKIVQTPKLVVLLSEGNTHSYRRFFLDGRAHNLELDPAMYTGDSTASWDGDTLVVDTIGFNDKTWLDSTGKPHSDALHVIERYRRLDLGHLEIQYKLEDEKAFTKPYTFTRTLTLAPNWEIQEYICQEILDGTVTH